MQPQPTAKLPVRLTDVAAWLIATVAGGVAFSHLVHGHSVFIVAAVSLVACTGPFMALNAVFAIVNLNMKAWLLVAIGGFTAFVLYWLALVAIF